jgi:hypothetical protein
MAVRTPLALAGSNFREMTSAEITGIRNEAIRLYGTSPSVTLSVVSSGGNLGTINDTRQQAGAGITRVDRFATTAELGNVSTITVGYSRVNQAVNTAFTNWNDATYSYPLYFDGSNIREFSAADFADTFIIPAIDTLTASTFGTAQAGTYFVSTATSVTGATLISSTPIFTDTRANADAYTAAGLIETRDQPGTVANYYLHRANAAAASFLSLPICYTKSGINISETPIATFRTALQTMIKYYAAEVTGTRIRYSLNGTGTNRGTAMTNTARSGSKYQTYQVNTNDYRAQETPDYNVSPSTVSTNYLRIYQV